MLTQLTEIAQQVNLAPGARIAALLHHQTSNAYPDYRGDTFLAELLVPTLSAAIDKVTAGYGDTIIALPGHAENVTTTPTFKADMRLIGFGRGSSMPNFRWTATSSQWAIAAANVDISGLRLRLEGANGVVKGIVWTATGCRLANCLIEVASGATAKATIALEVGAGAHELLLENLHMFGTATHNVTDGIKIVAAVNDFVLRNSHLQFSATAANGNVHFTAAALRYLIDNCVMYNTHTASTANIALDDNIAMDGFVTRCLLGQKNDGTITAQGLVYGGTECLGLAGEVYATDAKATNGALSPAAST